MSFSTQPRQAFKSISPNVTRTLTAKSIPSRSIQFEVNAKPYRTRKQLTYTIQELLSTKENSIPYTLPLEAIVAIEERAEIPYKTPSKHLPIIETDSRKVEAREKQITYGKATEGYKNYTHYVPYESRQFNDPKTPEINQVCSKRSWDGQVRKWRRELHAFDEMKSAEDLAEARRKAGIVHATPSKNKLAMTEPVMRERKVLRNQNFVAKILSFED
ncbi:hypothetical protein EIN_064820 [Entamoeba invadens IP1]|uniref:Histone RNA hairpin-binding protein RNA-binding domain-containing protein n=2 Tax=Entamoeba invadens TaxID=33085 RepID=A0A0A1TV85_ENTIV|nr:hypothetical protein EIN_064820 [Entamoeba invadens IP1]BAN40406.1 hypothetical protein [Entamoeba invadens]ELP84247.1 hypothetical protein EIN_064820 [Entamoeba invadens IP1]BAN40859.1 hypothetical protein [Entamoeba invadens]BAN41339.1 hypothetical protein [Entamoeba invadens]BAN42368.1 hypothetical protein [Entamoeba invadens]|eukprot:XP_004183593.1 hypothetical protein EIN_064820 [Entamoeba invadens IP1]